MSRTIYYTEKQVWEIEYSLKLDDEFMKQLNTRLAKYNVPPVSEQDICDALQDYVNTNIDKEYEFGLWNTSLRYWLTDYILTEMYEHKDKHEDNRDLIDVRDQEWDL